MVERHELTGLLNAPDLADYLNRVDKIIRSNTADSVFSSTIEEVFSGGKRLRPAMTLAAAAMGAKDIDENALNAAAAVEMVHQASLVHDDIIDESPLRHGRPSVAAAEGRDAAIIVGDYLIAAGCELAARVSPECAIALSSAVMRMSEGQALELRHPNKSLGKLYIRIARLKAGALFGSACLMGGFCGGLDKSQISPLGLYGELFGIAFQISDDITDGDIENQNLKKADAKLNYYVSSAGAALQPLPKTRVKGLIRLADALSTRQREQPS